MNKNQRVSEPFLIQKLGVFVREGDAKLRKPYYFPSRF